MSTINRFFMNGGYIQWNELIHNGPIFAPL